MSNVNGMTPISSVSDPALNAYERAFDGFADGILLINEDGAINLANAKVTDQLGYESGILSGALIFSVNPYLPLLNWKKTWKKLKAGEVLEEETAFMHAKGNLVPVRTRACRLKINERVWAMITIDFLLDSRRYLHLLNSVTEIAKLCSWELNFISKELSLFGDVHGMLELPEGKNIFRADEIKNVFSDHLPIEDYEKLNQAVKGLIKGKKNGSFELEIIFNRVDGSFDRLQIYAQAFKTDGYTNKVYGTAKKAFQQERDEEASYLSNFTLDHVSDLIFWVREDASIAYVNKAVCERLGYTRKEMLRMNSQQITRNFSQADRDQLWAKLREEKHHATKFDLVTKSGDIVPVLSSTNYLVYEGEEFNCAFAKDITQQEEENRQLKLVQFSIENAHEMILWVDTNGEVQYVNTKFLRNTGYDEEECLSLNFRQFLFRDVIELTLEDEWQQLKAQGELEIETGLKRKDGSTIPVYCTFNHILYESREFICIYLLNWSDKKKKDTQLFLAQNALDSAQDMIFWIDESLKITYKNEAARKKLGYSRGELKGADFKEICRDINLKTIIAEDNSDHFETDFYTKRREKIPVEVSISPAQFKGNRYSCMIVRDIANRKKNEQRLLDNKEKIEELSLKLKDENILLKEEISSNYNFNNIITQNKSYRQVLSQIAQVADSEATVLIQGETGTGKELLARAIYSLSDREDRAFIKVNCAALPKNLIESELFGHEKGAFTGAIQQKKGRFELADQGTIFLDEIGELPLDLQVKLLRVLQEGEFERLGGNKTLKVDVRIVAATNRNLEEMVEQGTFREDLFYRLNVFPIANPPLRSRKEDIPLLVKHFAQKYGKRMGKKIKKITEADIRKLQQYDFPGNVRELENMVERAMILAKNGVLNLKASLELVKDQENAKEKQRAGFPTFEEMQKEHIVEALRKCNMRVTGPQGAARLLDLNDRTLMSKMRKLGIKREDYL